MAAAFRDCCRLQSMAQLVKIVMQATSTSCLKRADNNDCFQQSMEDCEEHYDLQHVESDQVRLCKVQSDKCDGGDKVKQNTVVICDEATLG